MRQSWKFNFSKIYFYILFPDVFKKGRFIICFVSTFWIYREFKWKWIKIEEGSHIPWVSSHFFRKVRFLGVIQHNPSKSKNHTDSCSKNVRFWKKQGWFFKNQGCFFQNPGVFFLNHMCFFQKCWKSTRVFFIPPMGFQKTTGGFFIQTPPMVFKNHLWFFKTQGCLKKATCGFSKNHMWFLKVQGWFKKTTCGFWFSYQILKGIHRKKFCQSFLDFLKNHEWFF